MDTTKLARNLERQERAIATTHEEIAAFEKVNKDGKANRILAALNVKLRRQEGIAEITRTSIELLSRKK